MLIKIVISLLLFICIINFCVCSYFSHVIVHDQISVEREIERFQNVTGYPTQDDINNKTKEVQLQIINAKRRIDFLSKKMKSEMEEAKKTRLEAENEAKRELQASKSQLNLSQERGTKNIDKLKKKLQILKELAHIPLNDNSWPFKLEADLLEKEIEIKESKLKGETTLMESLVEQEFTREVYQARSREQLQVTLAKLKYGAELREAKKEIIQANSQNAIFSSPGISLALTDGIVFKTSKFGNQYNLIVANATGFLQRVIISGGVKPYYSDQEIIKIGKKIFRTERFYDSDTQSFQVKTEEFNTYKTEKAQSYLATMSLNTDKLKVELHGNFGGESMILTLPDSTTRIERSMDDVGNVIAYSIKETWNLAGKRYTTERVYNYKTKNLKYLENSQ